jgi:hypothetical protein
MAFRAFIRPATLLFLCFIHILSAAYAALFSFPSSMTHRFQYEKKRRFSALDAKTLSKLTPSRGAVRSRFILLP